jgi:hypothetical protein
MKMLYKVLILVIVLMVAASPAAAWYNSVTGEIRDNDTGQLWEYGATVIVYDCADSIPKTSTYNVSTPPWVGYGTFDIPLSPAFQTVENICIEIDFEPVNGYDPGKRILWIPNDSGGSGVPLDVGTIYTNTGPTAVVLSGFTASPASNQPWQIYAIAAAILALLSAGFSFFRQKGFGRILNR